MASTTYEIGEIEDRQILERTLRLIEGPTVMVGAKAYAPTSIVTMWSRTRHSDWVLISIAMGGERVTRDERGAPERHPEQVILERYQSVGFAPAWMISAAKANRPPKGATPDAPASAGSSLDALKA